MGHNQMFWTFEDSLGLLDCCFSLTIGLVVVGAGGTVWYAILVMEFLKFGRCELQTLVTDYLIRDSISSNMSLDILWHHVDQLVRTLHFFDSC